MEFYGCPPSGTCYTSRVAVSGGITNASVAQLVEQLTLNQLVLGSNPSRGTFSAENQWVKFVRMVRFDSLDTSVIELPAAPFDVKNT